MPTGVDDGGHHDLEQRVEAGDRVLGGVGLGERGEVADVDEHHRHFAALTGEDIVALLKQPRRQGRVDVGAERGLKSLPLSQTRLHPVKRGRQRTEVIVLNHRQALAVIAGRDTFSSFGEVANGLQGRRERGADGDRHPEDKRQPAPDHNDRATGTSPARSSAAASIAPSRRTRTRAAARQVRPRGKSRARAGQGVADPRVTGESDPGRPQRCLPGSCARRSARRRFLTTAPTIPYWTSRDPVAPAIAPTTTNSSATQTALTATARTTAPGPGVGGFQCLRPIDLMASRPLLHKAEPARVREEPACTPAPTRRQR